ncbi:hypothetical protein [Phaeocystidibacter luteus]|uniref:Uncharacterized protein n=1 Tax=Phaeocystidibacter luteus TaxID=911197 RepID=A0A6N6RJD8_9FLAO|nr:hypothetical protein [Phaeocystidibacter luteus]KAB2813691.1 hypothetical protein F8C67_05900 [Phaeocystidibacter luteus]
MLNNKITGVLLLSGLIACTPEIEETQRFDTPEGLSGLQAESGHNNYSDHELNPEYEYYNWGTEHPYEALETELRFLFSEAAENGNTDLTKAIWTWETGINYLHIDEVTASSNVFVSEYDKRIEESVEFELALDNGNVSNDALRTAIESTSDLVILKEAAGLNHSITDVQFWGITDGLAKLKVVSVFFQTPRTTPYLGGTGPVPPATFDGMVGQRTACGGTGLNNIGVWKEMGNNALAAMPPSKYGTLLFPNGLKSVTNVFTVTAAYDATNSRKVDPTYLPGHVNSIHLNHRPVCHVTECMTASQNDDYTQQIVNQLSTIIGKPGIPNYEGVKDLIVDNGNVRNTSVNYGYKCKLLKWYSIPNNHQRMEPHNLF